ncbi:hypothetical protein B296_00030199 [Ensete ventricosum]|uniref:Uncharacterized protein n=1 Tax=Ensete ventricosum TaxID=4639 RepID=A0A426Y1W8_ENSVE|nr:hypothetical protein B296_00030199 [Ensete ventricosum]
MVLMSDYRVHLIFNSLPREDHRGLGTRCFPAMSCTIGLISLMCSPHKEGIAGTRYLDGVGTRIGIKLFRFLHRPPVAELEEGERKGSHLLPLVRSETMESVD